MRSGASISSVGRILDADAFVSIDVMHAALDTMLAVSINTKDRQRFDMAEATLRASRKFRAFSGGRTDVLSLCARAELLVLETRNYAGPAPDELRHQAAECLQLLIRDIELSRDAKRAMYGEQVMLVESCVRLYDRRLSAGDGGGACWRQLALAYGQAGEHHLDKLAAQVLEIY